MLNIRSVEDVESSRMFRIAEREPDPMRRREGRNPYLAQMISVGRRRLVGRSSSLPPKYRDRSVSEIAVSGYHAHLGSHNLP